MFLLKFYFTEKNRLLNFVVVFEICYDGPPWYFANLTQRHVHIQSPIPQNTILFLTLDAKILITVADSIYFQNVFVIKPIEDSPQCLTYVPNPTTSHEDTFIYGDDKGFIKLVTLAAKDLTMKNSKGDKKNTQNLVVEPANLTKWVEDIWSNI